MTGQTSGFSQHAYGWAIDIDPTQNPYVTGDGEVLRRRASRTWIAPSTSRG